MVMKYPDLFGTSIQDKWKEMEAGWIKEQAALDQKYSGLTDDQAKALQGEVTKESMDRADMIFKQIKATEKEMEDKIREEKGLEADFVYDGYNKANLMAAAEKILQIRSQKLVRKLLEIPLKRLAKPKIQVWSSQSFLEYWLFVDLV